MTLTTVFIADVSPLADSALFDKYYAAMPEYRREKIDVLKCRDDKIRSLGAGILLSRALSRAGVDENAEISVDGKGKPYLKGRNDLYFNLSHSGNLVMCAVSEREVGCDIERVQSGRLDVAKRFFTDEERAFVDLGADEDEKNTRFARVWTLKESFVKANGAGLALGLRNFSVVPNGEPITLDFDGKRYNFYEIDTKNDGYKASVCVAGGDESAPDVIFENF